MHTLMLALWRSVGRAVASRRQRGAALLLAIWLSGSAAVLALAFVARTSPQLEAGFLEVEMLRADTLALNALHHAVAEIANGEVAFDPIPARVTLEVGADIASIEIRPESGKLDLNAAPPESLRELLVELGVEGDVASSAVLELERLRERVRPQGVSPAALPTSQAALEIQGPVTAAEPQASITADNRPAADDRVTLSSLAVLNLLPGLSSTMRERLVDHVTIATGETLPERELASEPVRLALLRTGEVTPLTTAGTAQQAASAALDRDPSGLYGLSISVRIGDKVRRQRRALVWLPEEGDALFHVLDWSAPGRYRDSSTAATPGDAN